MRHISFSLTTRQFNDRSKTVTRRMGWLNLKVGEVLQGVEKAQGLKKGEKVKKLHQIKVKDVRREILFRMYLEYDYGIEECGLEGFPELEPHQFVETFMKAHRGCEHYTKITRIEFEHLPDEVNP